MWWFYQLQAFEHDESTITTCQDAAFQTDMSSCGYASVGLSQVLPSGRTSINVQVGYYTLVRWFFLSSALIPWRNILCGQGSDTHPLHQPITFCKKFPCLYFYYPLGCNFNPTCSCSKHTFYRRVFDIIRNMVAYVCCYRLEVETTPRMSRIYMTDPVLLLEGQYLYTLPLHTV